MWGGVPFINSFVGPAVDRFYFPMIIIVLFGPALAASGISIWFIKRCYRRLNQHIPLRVWFIAGGLTLLAMYLGPFFAFNSFGT